MSAERIVHVTAVKTKPHPTRRVTIKSAAVDLGMIPVVEWINSHEWAFTRHSCQGNDPPKKGRKGIANAFAAAGVELPYCVFYCEDSLTLIRITKALYCLATVEVDWYEGGGSLRYVARFHSREHLKEFVADLRRRTK